MDILETDLLFGFLIFKNLWKSDCLKYSGSFSKNRIESGGIIRKAQLSLYIPNDAQKRHPPKPRQKGDDGIDACARSFLILEPWRLSLRFSRLINQISGRYPRSTFIDFLDQHFSGCRLFLEAFWSFLDIQNVIFVGTFKNI